MKKIYERIKSRRKQLNISQGEMASKLGMLQGAYSKLENGKSILTINKLLIIRNILKVPISYFFDENLNGIIDKELELLKDLHDVNIENSRQLNLKPIKSASPKQQNFENGEAYRIISSQLNQLDANTRLISYQQQEINKLKTILTAIFNDNKIKKQLKPHLREELIGITRIVKS